MPNINPRIRSLDDLLGVARKVENTAATEDKPAQPGNNEIQMLPPEIIRGFRGHPIRTHGFMSLKPMSCNGPSRKCSRLNGRLCWPCATPR